MSFHAVGSRCAVDLAALRLPVSVETAESVLERKGFRRVDVDIIALARTLVGTAEYRRGARMKEAPRVFDCSSMMKWLYAQKGVWLPRRSIQQRQACTRVSPERIIAGDLVFTTGHVDYFDTDPTDGVGHVGLATGVGTIIHAANVTHGIVESSFDRFVKGVSLRGVGRRIPDGARISTYECPAEREIESSDDLRWVILQSLPRR